jgi:signal transduction histidine kinase
MAIATSIAPPAGPHAGRSPNPWVLAAIAALGCAAPIRSIGIALASDNVDLVQVGLLDWVTVPFILAGLVAWLRRPDSRLGLLMIGGGCAAGLSALQLTHVDGLYTIGAVFDVLPAALFLHVCLAFPDGRLRSGFEAALITAAYTAAIGLQLAKMSVGVFGPHNLLTIAPSVSLAKAISHVQLLSLSVFCLVGIGVLAARRWHAGRPRRHSLGLLIDSFAVGLVMIAVLFVVGDLFGGAAFQPIQRATLLVIGISPIVFLAGLLDARLARAAVGDLILELQAEPAPADLRDSLAHALRDPSLTLAYWLPDFEVYVDLDGRPVTVPDEEARTATRIDRNGSQVAVLIHDGALDDEPELLEAVGAAAGIALENGRLHAELLARVDELRGSRARVIEAGLKERQRLERNLHDGAQQRLIALSLELGLLQEGLSGDGEVGRRLDEARREIATSLEELRDIARGLHPAVVSGHGLHVALEQLAARAPVPVRLNVEVEERLPESLEVTAFYLVSESLSNIGKHAFAKSATVDVARANGQVVVEVVDDGVGGADTERGSGLRGLADRVEALEGRLRVWSPGGGGTRLRAEIPCV